MLSSLLPRGQRSLLGNELRLDYGADPLGGLFRMPPQRLTIVGPPEHEAAGHVLGETEHLTCSPVEALRAVEHAEQVGVVPLAVYGNSIFRKIIPTAHLAVLVQGDLDQLGKGQVWPLEHGGEATLYRVVSLEAVGEVVYFTGWWRPTSETE